MKRRAVVALALAASVALALYLRWPALRAGFHTDDVVQLAMLRGEFPAERHFWDLYRFADVVRDGTVLMDAGYLPWWSQADLRIAMFRPLSSALLWVDHSLFGEAPLPYHVHSLVWCALAIAAAALLYARVLSLPALVVALALFAMDEGLSAPAFWIANRSTLVAVTFGLIGVWAHVTATLGGGRKWRALEAGAFGLAFLGGEYGIAFVAYVVAFQVFERRDPIEKKLRALIPVAIPLGACLVIRQLLGYGIRGSGYYIGPFDSPGRFFNELGSRLPALWADAILGIPAQNWSMRPNERSVQAFLGVVSAIGLILVSMWIDGRRDSHPKGVEPANEARPGIAWLPIGGVLATFTAGGALPEDRLLLFAAVGTAGALATIVVETVRVLRARKYVLAAAGIALCSGIVHVHALQAFARGREIAMVFLHGTSVQQAWSLKADIPEAPAHTQRILILSATDFTTAAHLPWVRRLAGHELPLSYFRLGGTTQVQEIRRTAPNAIEVSVLSDDVDGSMAGSLYRSEDHPLRRGDVVNLKGVRVEVVATARKNPWRTRFTFDRNLDDPSVVFVHSKRHGMVRYSPPAVGERLRLPSPAPPSPS